MNEPEKVIIDAKVQRASAPAGGAECLIDGHAIGEPGMVPGILEAEAGGSCSVKISDGYRTGEVVSVPDRYVVGFGEEAVQDAAKRLFR